MFSNEAISLKVRTGPLAGHSFNNLIEYIEAYAEEQQRCPHVKTKVSSVVSGIETKTPHLTTATVCCHCHKVLKSTRVRISRKQAQLIQRRKQAQLIQRRNQT